MTPNSAACLSGRPSRKRETGQTVAENAVALALSAIGATVLLVILSGGVEMAVERASEQVSL